MPQFWTINSNTSLIAFKQNVEKLYKEHKYITYPQPRIGPDRSLDQNALFHVWATEYVAFILKKDKREVTPGELDGMKRAIKKKYTAAHPEAYAWMVYEIVNPFTGQSRKDYTSSKTWKVGEAFMVLSWIQMVAAEDGLILEAKGQFNKLQREHSGD